PTSADPDAFSCSATHPAFALMAAWWSFLPGVGVLPLVPDSPSWFAWLGELTAFSFEGQHGHFSATRKFRHGEPIQSWNIHRSLHGRSCTLYLGQTSTLTLARGHSMVLAVHARLTSS